MLVFLGKRLAGAVVLLVFATFFTFVLASETFDPMAAYKQRNPPPPAAAIHAKEHELRLDTPVLERYVLWLGDISHASFGNTIADTPVAPELEHRIGVTLRLVLLGALLGTLFGVLLGVVSAVRQYKFTDRATTFAAFVVLSAPAFLVATVFKLLALTANSLIGRQVFLYTGEQSAIAPQGFWAGFADSGQHLVLPTLTLAVIEAAMFSRYQRNAMLDVLGSDFLRTARAKGLTKTKALFKHGLRTALIPMTTLFAFGFGGLVAGAAFTERVFGWNGVGTWLIDGIGRQDTNIVTAITFFAAVVILLAGLVADVAQGMLDPRVRAS
jgi:peptide/nickel transport system permease protein